jgi:NAD(P)-dependent dehydrogenase (short-subunit alcohol dehydrogenase family)
MKPLEGRVALVAGATRGGGRGIARMLGEAGATVYCTGRSSRTQPNTSTHHYAGRPETIEETAEMVTAAGGVGVAVRVDHNVEPEVAALFKRIAREQNRLDVLVNILTGRPVASWSSFWKQPLDEGRGLVDSWIWPHVMTSWHAAPLMVKRLSARSGRPGPVEGRRPGLIVEVVEQPGIGYHGTFFFDLMETALKRLAYGLAVELAPHKVTAVAVTPGFMRTEAILDGFGVTEANWRDAIDHPKAKGFGWAGSETPCFLGRGIAALAADPEVQRKSGGLFGSWALSDEYGFTDTDGARPHWGRYGKEHFPQFFDAKSTLPYEWQLTAVTPRP